MSTEGACFIDKFSSTNQTTLPDVSGFRPTDPSRCHHKSFHMAAAGSRDDECQARDRSHDRRRHRSSTETGHPDGRSSWEWKFFGRLPRSSRDRFNQLLVRRVNSESLEILAVLARASTGCRRLLQIQIRNDARRREQARDASLHGSSKYLNVTKVFLRRWTGAKTLRIFWNWLAALDDFRNFLIREVA
jgi:hypothetical protein